MGFSHNPRKEYLLALHNQIVQFFLVNVNQLRRKQIRLLLIGFM